MYELFPTLPRSRRLGFYLSGLLLAHSTLAASPEEFSAYWYQGQAEITSYTLEQARYGEVHQGDAVLIFVTEDFSKGKQVKLDNPAAAGNDAVPVLKLNMTKKFTTGVYPYSMMTSVFTPVDRQEALKTIKITTSSQEWCGHTFTQLNLAKDGYRVRELSYFESEGDRDLKLEAAAAEDGLWTLLRIDPSALPTGRVRLIPGSMFQRLRHRSWASHEADAALVSDPESPALMVYSLHYPDLDRTLAIHFQKAAPHEIESWEETYVSGWGPGASRLTTRAVKKKRMMLDYWRRHGVEDVTLRRELGLD